MWITDERLTEQIIFKSLLRFVARKGSPFYCTLFGVIFRSIRSRNKVLIASDLEETDAVENRVSPF